MNERLTQPIVCSLLIGRDPMVAALQQQITEVGHTTGQMVLISGEAGIGKSRLVSEARTFATARGMQVLQGVCFPQDRTCPYAPLLEILRARFAGHAPAAITATVGPFVRELAPLLPELLPLVAPAYTDAPPEGEPAQRRLFDALVYCLTPPTAPANAPAGMLLIVEDLHWCDESSLDFLLYLLRYATNQPLLLLGTYRSEEVTPTLQQWLAQLDRTRLAQELALPRLQRNEVAAMLVAILGYGTPVRSEFLDWIYDLSEGNPFYVEELLKSLIAAGDLFYADDAWHYKPLAELQLSRSLQATVQQRMGALTTAAQELLTLAAVIGRRFDFQLLQRLARIDEYEMLRRIKELITAQMVVEASPDQFAFRHALTRQAIYGQLLVRERTTLHRAIAETIEQVYAEALEPHLGDLAYHFFEAQAWEPALRYAQRAGARAQRLHAVQATVEHLTRALEAARQLTTVAPLDELPRLNLTRTQLALERGRAYEALGRFPPARADYTTTLEFARASDDTRLEWQALHQLGMLWTGRDYAQAGSYYQQALELARRLDDPALIGHSLNRIGNWHANAAEPQEALRLHHEAFAIFEQIADRNGMAETLQLLGTASHLSADTDSSVRYFERATRLYQELDDERGWTTSLTMTMLRSSTYTSTPRSASTAGFQQAVRDGEQALARAQAREWHTIEAFVLYMLGSILGPAGEYARALEIARRSLQIAEEVGHLQRQATAHWLLGMLYLDLPAPPAARPHLEQAMRLSQELGSIYWIHVATSATAVLHILERNLKSAEKLLTDATTANLPVHWIGHDLFVWAQVQLLLARHDPARALDLLDQAHQSVPAAAAPADTPRLAVLRGEALIALGQLEEAVTVLTRTQETLRMQGMRGQLWRSHVALGNLRHTRQEFDAARQEFDSTRAIVEELAANLPDDQVRDTLLQRVTALFPRRYRMSKRRRQAAKFGGLTDREREVAILVGQGKTNRAIADQLIIGERTVETHISNILAKLNYTSRQEIAAWAQEQGLVPTSQM